MSRVNKRREVPRNSLGLSAQIRRETSACRRVGFPLLPLNLLCPVEIRGRLEQPRKKILKEYTRTVICCPWPEETPCGNQRGCSSQISWLFSLFRLLSTICATAGYASRSWRRCLHSHLVKGSVIPERPTKLMASWSGILSTFFWFHQPAMTQLFHRCQISDTNACYRQRIANSTGVLALRLTPGTHMSTAWWNFHSFPTFNGFKLHVARQAIN